MAACFAVAFPILAIPEILAILTLLVWVYLLLAHGEFWRIKKRLAPEQLNRLPSCRIAAIVPARNEAEVIGESISSLLSQIGCHGIHIFLVDDSSSDGTAEIARQSAERAGKSAALTVIQGKLLPPGWTGKLWAIHQGIECAQEFAPEFFLLTDADIQHAPDGVSMLVSIAESGPYDLASFIVKLRCAGFAEKLLIPALSAFVDRQSSAENSGRCRWLHADTARGAPSRGRDCLDSQ